MFLLDGLVVLTVVTSSWKIVRKLRFLLHEDCKFFVEHAILGGGEKLAIRRMDLTSWRGSEKTVSFSSVRQVLHVGLRAWIFFLPYT